MSITFLTIICSVLSFQSAYIKHHSTETALLSVHDHIIRAISHQQVTCLTLLDLSAAFDTIDHSILLERLSSWFGISSIALSWIKSYLLNRSFYVNIENSQSSVFQLLYGVPQGSVLGPLLFILNTSPLSTMIVLQSYLIHQQIIIFLLMTLNCFFHSLLLILLITSLILKTLYLMFLTGCHPTFFLSILLKLSFLSLVFHNNSLNSTVQSFIYLTTSHCRLLLLLVI